MVGKEFFYLHERYLDSAAMTALRSLEGPMRAVTALGIFYILCGWCSRNKIEHIPAACALGEGLQCAPRDVVLRALGDLVWCGAFLQFTHGYLPSPLLVRFDEPEGEVKPPAPLLLPRKPPPALPAPSKPGFVYFVETVEASGPGDIKIGFATNVAVRIDALQTGSPKKLRLLATMPGTYQTERGLHERFAHLALRGEWFRPEPDLLAFIDGLSPKGGAT